MSFRIMAPMMSIGGLPVAASRWRNNAPHGVLNGVGQVTLALHLRGAVDVPADGFDQVLDLFIEPFDVPGNSAANRFAGDLEAIAFLNPHGVQGIQARHQRLQRLLADRRRLPGFGPTFGAEAGDQLGVDRVGLAAGQAGLGEGLDLKGIDHAHRMTGTGQMFGDGFPVSARGFHADMERSRTLLVKSSIQLGKAFRGVGQAFATKFTVGQTQGAIKFGFGDVDTEMKRRHVNTPELGSEKDSSNGLPKDLPCECGLPT